MNALPQFTTEIDGVNIHFIHVRSPHENALPLIMTHGWPGSVMELIDSVGPLTDPTVHGGGERMPSILCCPPCRGTASQASRSRSAGIGRTARAWAALMDRLGYTRDVAQGGDVGAGVTDVMGRQEPEGLIGIHTNLLVPALGGAMPTDTAEERAAAAQIDTFQQSGNGYFVEMATRPQTIGYALLDLRSPGGLDGRPRHGQLLQDLPRLRRRAALGQPHPGPHPRQHHDVSADRHRRLRSPVVPEAYGPDAPAAGREPLPPSSIPVGFTTFPG